MQVKHIYTYKIYIIPDSAPKHGKNPNKCHYNFLKTDVYLKPIL